MFTLLKKELNNVTFDDIKGLGDTKTELMFIVNQMKNWKQLGELGQQVHGVESAAEYRHAHRADGQTHNGTAL